MKWLGAETWGTGDGGQEKRREREGKSSSSSNINNLHNQFESITNGYHATGVPITIFFVWTNNSEVDVEQNPSRDMEREKKKEQRLERARWKKQMHFDSKSSSLQYWTTDSKQTNKQANKLKSSPRITSFLHQYFCVPSNFKTEK